MGIDTEYALVPLTQGKFAVVDICDYGRVAAKSWHAQAPSKKSKAWRVSGSLPRSSGKRHVLMHRFILEAQNKISIDHANGNALDNRRRNLRFASQSEQRCNTSVSKRNKLGVKGVYLHCPGWYRSYIAKDGKKYDLGTFKTIEEASTAYNAAALRLHGSFARVEVGHS